jgi:hypothetical protein
MDRSYSIGFEYIDDTVAHTGRFWQIYALADASIASAVMENQTGNTFHNSAIKSWRFCFWYLYQCHIGKRQSCCL